MSDLARFVRWLTRRPRVWTLDEVLAHFGYTREELED